MLQNTFFYTKPIPNIYLEVSSYNWCNTNLLTCIWKNHAVIEISTITTTAKHSITSCYIGKSTAGSCGRVSTKSIMISMSCAQTLSIHPQVEMGIFTIIDP